MKFTMLVAMLATVQMAAAAQGEPTVVLIPANSQVYQQPAAQAQPATVVEAAPVTESKAEAMRKARQNQEVQTEQKIVEKLEESRLREEQQRAERLFGDKLNDNTAPVVAAPVAAPVAQPVVAPAPVPAQPQQVTIEKIEIVQPAAPVAEKEVEKAAPVAESVVDVKDEPAPAFKQKFYVGGTLAVPSYGAANLKTNYGAGVIAGIQVDPNWAFEGMFLFSNHVVDTFWKAPLYSDMDQYDFQATAKYFVMTDKLKPYVGASASYVTRRYTDKMKGFSAPAGLSESQDTYTMNVGLVAGVDFEVNDKITIGGGIDYNTPVMKKNEFNEQRFGLPDNTKPVEEFDYTTLKVNARMSF